MTAVILRGRRRSAILLRRWCGRHRRGLAALSASLKARVALGVMALLLTAMGATAWHMEGTADRQIVRDAAIREQVASRQFTALVGHRTASLQQALRLVAAQIDAHLIEDPQRATAYLATKPVLASMFANVFVASIDGHVRVLLEGEHVRPVDTVIADRDYFKQLLLTGQPVVSAPMPGRISNEPVVIFAYPVFEQSEAGQPTSRIVGVVGGALRLVSRGLLQDLAEAWDNDDSSMLVVTDGNGTILAHPQSAMVMSDLGSEPRLASTAVQWRREGRPSVQDTEHWRSDTDIVTMATESTTGWRVWRVVSRDSLLQPVRAARIDALRLALGIAALFAVLTMAFVAWQLQPLSALERRAHRLMLGDNRDDWPVGRGEIGRLAATLRHVWAERVQVEQFNAHILQKLTSVMSASPVGLIFMRNQSFELISAECCRLLGQEETALTGKPCRAIFAAAEDFDRMEAAALLTFEGQQAYEGEWRLRRANGESFWARLRARPVDPHSCSAGLILSLYNIDDQVLARTALQQAALHDALTGLENRKSFERAVQTAFDRQGSGQPASLLMIDLDRFKAINDEAGHGAGDEMLKAVARALTSSVRVSDHAARIGGDEFAVLLPGCADEHALDIASKIRRAICDATVLVASRPYSVGASLGVAALRPQYADTTEWLHAADTACYQAKKSGGNAVALAPARAVAFIDACS